MPKPCKLVRGQSQKAIEDMLHEIKGILVLCGFITHDTVVIFKQKTLPMGFDAMRRSLISWHAVSNPTWCGGY